MRLKLMADYDCWPIWLDDEVGNVDPATLAISAELRDRLRVWAARFDAILVRDDPVRSSFGSEAAERSFHLDGVQLVVELQNELGSAHSVRYGLDTVDDEGPDAYFASRGYETSVHERSLHDEFMAAGDPGRASFYVAGRSYRCVDLLRAGEVVARDYAHGASTEDAIANAMRRHRSQQ
jgi:hypothetical protein